MDLGCLRPLLTAVAKPGYSQHFSAFLFACLSLPLPYALYSIFTVLSRWDAVYLYLLLSKPSTPRFVFPLKTCGSAGAGGGRAATRHRSTWPRLHRTTASTITRY